MTDETIQPSSGRKRVRLIAVVAVLAVALVAVIARASVSAGGGDEANQPVFQVAQGPLTISVTESGTIQPKDQITIKSQVEGSSTILYLIDEGAHVHKGDLLVQLDSSSLEDSKVDQEIRVQNAEAAYVSAKENLDVVRNQAQSDTDEAELTLKFAQEDLKNYTDGEYPNQEKELQANVNLTQEELQRAEDTLGWSQRLAEQNYISGSELKADELAHNKAQLNYELSQRKLALLQDFTYKRELDQRQSDVKQAQMALERTKLKASADVVQAEAKSKAAESEYTREQSKLDKVNKQIENTKIIAPADGLVVYATSAQGGRPWRNTEPLDEGQQVRERQELIYLPTGDTFKAEVSVQESSLQKVHTGLPVRVTVDALPGQVFHGTVASIAPLPDAQSMFMNPDLKVYTTVVNIDDGGEQLRSGMTCKAEIVVAQYQSAMYVPIQSVVRVQGKPTAFVKGPRGVEATPVEIGLDNNTMVRVISGLQPGESVLLNPPLAAAVAVEEPAQPASGTGITAAPAGSQPATTTPGAAGPAEQNPGTTPPAATGAPSAGASQPGEGGGRGGRGGPGGGSWGGRGGGRGGRLSNLTPEQREQMRQRYQNMTPEEREQMRSQWQSRRQQQGADAEGATQ